VGRFFLRHKTQKPEGKDFKNFIAPVFNTHKNNHGSSDFIYGDYGGDKR
jgi:hypothetical protein